MIVRNSEGFHRVVLLYSEREEIANQFAHNIYLVISCRLESHVDYHISQNCFNLHEFREKSWQ